MARRGLISCPAWLCAVGGRVNRPAGPSAPRPYTPAVRRWFRLVALSPGSPGLHPVGPHSHSHPGRAPPGSGPSRPRAAGGARWGRPDRSGARADARARGPATPSGMRPMPPAPSALPPPPPAADPAPEASLEQPPSGRRRLAVGMIALLVVVRCLPGLAARPGRAPTPAIAADPSHRHDRGRAPASIDPAKHGDLGSASYVSQLYETLTAVDTSLAIRPALAESWTVDRRGTQGDLHAAPRPGVQRRFAAARRGRRPQLAPPVRPVIRRRWRR